MYALANSLADGLDGAFSEGPYSEFDPDWMEDCGIPFVLSRESGPRIAHREMLSAVTSMSQGMFMRLHAEAYLAGPQRDAVEALLAGAPWRVGTDGQCSRIEERAEPDDDGLHMAAQIPVCS